MSEPTHPFDVFNEHTEPAYPSNTELNELLGEDAPDDTPVKSVEPIIDAPTMENAADPADAPTPEVSRVTDEPIVRQIMNELRRIQNRERSLSRPSLRSISKIRELVTMLPQWKEL